MVSRKRNKSQRDSQIKVVTRWDYTEEPNPAFRKLMGLLLQKGSKMEREVNDD